MGSLVEYIDYTSTLFLLVLGSLLLATLYNRHKKPLPPGPMGLPLIGSLNMMGQLTHHGLARLARKYGGLFYMRIGFIDMVTISSPEAAREVLQVQDIIFSNRPTTIAAQYLTYDRADMAFAHYGPFWRQIRKLSVMKLFCRQRAEYWRQSTRDEIDLLVRVIGGSIGSVIDLSGLVHSQNTNITYRAAFGSGPDEAREEFVGLVYELSRLFGEFNWADFIPWFQNGVSVGLVEARKALDRFIDKIIDDHVGNNKKGVTDDLVGELLRHYSENPNEGTVAESDDLHDHIRLTRDNIKGVIVDMMFGGSGTASTIIEWAMAELMKNPKIMKRAQQELAEVVGLHRQVEEPDLDKLNYLRCIVKETLRLHPPFPLLLHETAKETTIMGQYRVPAKARVMVNVWAIGRDKDSWADPDSFKPERFLEEGVPDFKGGNFEYIPFGSGRRSCPAMNLGLYVVEMTLANLVHWFEWELPDGINPDGLDMNELVGLTLPRASRLMVVPRARRDSCVLRACD